MHMTVEKKFTPVTTIQVQNLTSGPLVISIELVRGHKKSVKLPPNGSAQVDRDFLLLGRAQFLELRRNGLISYPDESVIALDEQEVLGGVIPHAILNLDSGNSNGLTLDSVPQTLGLNLATVSAAGAMSAADKSWLQSIQAQNILWVHQGSTHGPKQYASITEAIADIDSAAVDNPYAILVSPGVYSEPELVIPSYVAIVGTSMLACIVEPDANNHHIFRLQNNSSLVSLSLRDAGTGYAAIYSEDVGDFALVHKVTLTDCDIGVWATATTVDSYLYLEYVDTTGGDTAVKVVGSGSGYCFVNAENFYVFAELGSGANPTYGALVSGANAEFVCQASGFEGEDNTGVALEVSDGANIEIKGAAIRKWNKAIYSDLTGSNAVIRAAGMVLDDNTTDLDIANASTTGSFSGSATESKISLAVGLNFSLLVLDPEEGDIVTKGVVKTRQPDGSFADTSTLILQSGTMGILQGGDISDGTGLVVDVSEGFGYLEDLSDGSLKRFDWSDTNISVADNQSSYVYFNDSGVLTSGASFPNTRNTILLGRVVTKDGAILFIDQSPIDARHSSNQFDEILRKAIGPVYRSGSQVTEVGTRQLNVTAGEYFLSTQRFTPAGGNPISWISFYRNGSGGFTTGSQSTVDNGFWDNGTGTLVALSASHYAKHSLYLVGDGDHEQYMLVYSQAQYAELTVAEQSETAAPPSYFSDGVTLIATIIVQQGVSTLSVYDQRPRVGFAAAGVSAASIHGNLLQLEDDDHQQYLLVDGTRAMSGDLPMGGNNITGVGTVDGVDVSAHASRHLPSGADPLTTAAPAANLTASTSNAVGTANSLARSDHSHAITTGAASTQTPDQANAAGSSASLARADHVHNIPTEAPTTDLSASTSNTEGVAGSFSRSDHTHGIETGTPSTQTPDQANAEGVSANLARADHIHNIPTEAPATVGTANSEGTAGSFARSDHVHSHGDQAGGSLHAVATTSTAGFMSATDKQQTDDTAAQEVVRQEPTGFENRTDSSFSFNNGTRTFTIQPTGSSFSYWISGTKYTKSTLDSVVIDDTEGLHFLYYSGSTLIADASPAGVNLNRDVAFIALVYWDATNSQALILAEERHGTVMDWATHQLLHDTQGTQYARGLGLNNFTLDGDGSASAHAQMSVANGTIYDEDIEITIADGSPQELSPAASIPVFYRLGASANWRRKVGDSYPVIYSGSAGYTGANGRLAYNQFTGGAWQLTEVSGDNRFILVHFFATDDVLTPIIGVLGTAEYATVDTARDGSQTEISAISGLPTFEFTPIGTVIFETSSAFANAPKAAIRSTPGGAAYVDFRASKILTVSSPSHHSNLGGLDHDDHLQYLPRNGDRAMEAPLNMGGNDIGNVGTIDGVTITAHASRHLPSGADPLATAAPAANLTAATTNQTGTANSLARSDHSHAITTAAPSSLTPDQANAVGTAAGLARADHIHNVPAEAPTTSLSATTTNTEGVAASFGRSDHTHAILTDTPSTLNPDQANAAGTSASLARADHIHNVPAATAVTQTPDQANAEGVSTSFARADHVHQIATATASSISGNTNAQGVSTSFARADHTHQLTSGAASLDQVPQWSGTAWVETYPEEIIALQRVMVFSDDWVTGLANGLGWTPTNTGGSSLSQIDSTLVDQNHVGIVLLQGGNAAGRASVLSLAPVVTVGGGTLAMICLLRLGDLTTRANRVGYGDITTGADHNNGIYFEYNSAVGANWLIKTASGGTRTTTDTGVAVTAGEWHRLLITVNAAGTSVEFSLNGAVIGTITTNIPTGVLTPSIGCTSLAGVVEQLFVDYFKMWKRFTTPRFT
jgi:hypothetical protein